jgi:phosphonopyruvate decarboxylase
MIDPKLFIKILNKYSNFITGVPDSLLKNLLSEIDGNFRGKHIISTNEGSSIGLAIGSYLSSRKPSVVYMQNAGLGNAINPLISLADKNVYSIPMVLIIGWRGEVLSNAKQIKDEPQHVSQGKNTINLIKNLNISYKIISGKTKNIEYVLKTLFLKSLKINKPCALVVRKNTFKKLFSKKTQKKKFVLSREKAIEKIITSIPKNSIVVSTTGMISRELNEIRHKFSQKNIDFFVVGGMGHANQIATGIAANLPKKRIVCLDGDGSLLMHLGSMVISSKYKNMLHILLNNKSHDSVGGQPTPVDKVNFSDLAKSCGYEISRDKVSFDKISKTIKDCINKRKSSFIEIVCDKGHRNNLSRPNKNLKLRKIKFMKQIKR